jgi:hypothetical protein
MKEEVNAMNCGRENDLIAFLYGELSVTCTTVTRAALS